VDGPETTSDIFAQAIVAD